MQPELNLQPNSDPGDLVIKVIGVGGAGSNAVDRLKMDNPDRVQLAVVNTDKQALASSPVEEQLVIGENVTYGFGTANNAEAGRCAAEADREALRALVQDVDLLFLLAAMGGGTGGGASPVLAEVAREEGVLTIAFVTMPFQFEGEVRQRSAEEGLQNLRRHCDAVVPLPNDVLLQQPYSTQSVLDAFARADSWVERAVRSIWSILFRTGLINLDFTNLRQVFRRRGGKTLFGIGAAQGPDAVSLAINDLLQCPLLNLPEYSCKPDQLLVHILGGTNLTIAHVQRIMETVTESFGRDAQITLGASIEEDWTDQVEICVLGTTDVGKRSLAPPRRLRTRATSELVNRVVMPGEEAKPSAVRIPPRSEPAISLGHDEIVPVSAPVPVSVPQVPSGSHQEAPKTSARTRSSAPARMEQTEFVLPERITRGMFEESPIFLWKGEDLDQPTFLRRKKRGAPAHS